jgi:hypothetical protein
MEIEFRKEILKKVLELIEKEQENKRVRGLCDLVEDALFLHESCKNRVNGMLNSFSGRLNGDISNLIILKQCHKFYEDLKNDKEIIYKDIQVVNDIQFGFNEFYKPFCDIEWSNVNTIDDFKEWYKKRIEAIQKTIEYYNTKLN